MTGRTEIYLNIIVVMFCSHLWSCGNPESKVDPHVHMDMNAVFEDMNSQPLDMIGFEYNQETCSQYHLDESNCNSISECKFITADKFFVPNLPEGDNEICNKFTKTTDPLKLCIHRSLFPELVNNFPEGYIRENGDTTEFSAFFTPQPIENINGWKRCSGKRFCRCAYDIVLRSN